MDKVVGVVIPAAGRSRRMKSGVNKQFMLLAGKPVLCHSVDVFLSLEEVSQVVVVAHPEEIGRCRELLGSRSVLVVPGGEERQDSVYRGLRALARETELVAVHDGARPLLCSRLVRVLLDEAEKWGAVIPAVPVKDTLKEVDASGVVLNTLERSRIWQAQTPQVFSYRDLLHAYERAQNERFYGTDDASLFERYCGQVRVVCGDYRNIKITTPEDLLIAEALLSAGASTTRRGEAGNDEDRHRV